MHGSIGGNFAAAVATTAALITEFRCRGPFPGAYQAVNRDWVGMIIPHEMTRGSNDQTPVDATNFDARGG